MDFDMVLNEDAANFDYWCNNPEKILGSRITHLEKWILKK